MFRWYRNAVVCYVYLSDMPRCSRQSAVELKLSQSRWFHRGWTLQELIAPANIVFYSRDWHTLGTKTTLHQSISHITGIEREYLDGKNLHTASVAKRMSWAANRETTRDEDIAYCLLGIFDVNMPLLYGEGTRAFQRLQNEIMKMYPRDQTLFAWGVIVDRPSLSITDPDVITGIKQIPWEAGKVRGPLLGLLAESPEDFKYSSSLKPLPASSEFQEIYRYYIASRQGKGIRLGLVLGRQPSSTVHHRSQPGILRIAPSINAILLCRDDDNDLLSIILPLYIWGEWYHGRTRELTRGPIASRYNNSITIDLVHVEAEEEMQIENGDMLFRRLHCETLFWKMSHHCSGSWKSRVITGEYAFKSEESDQRLLFTHAFLPSNPGHNYGFSVVFRRTGCEGARSGSVAIGFVPTTNRRYGMAYNPDNVSWYSWSLSTDEVIKYCDFVAIDQGVAWILDVDPFPRIRVVLERVSLNEDGGFADVVDLTVTDRQGTLPDFSLLNFSSVEEQRQQLRFEKVGETISQRVSKRRRLL